MIMNPLIAAWKTANPKILIASGAALAIIGSLASTFANTFLVFLFTYAVVISLGIGFCYFPPLICGWEWIPERKGLVTGIILGAFGFGGFVFGILGMRICNPNNELPSILSTDGSKFYSKSVA